MTLDELIQEVMDILDAAFARDDPMTPDSTLESCGFDSLELIEVLLLLEERWPEATLEDYEPTIKITIREIAVEIEKRLPA